MNDSVIALKYAFGSMQKSMANINSFWDIIQEKYPKEHDYLVASVRAFRDGSCDFIIIDDRRKQFQIESSMLGVSLGLLTHEEIEINEQSTQWRFRLTELGKQIILDPLAHNKYHLPA